MARTGPPDPRLAGLLRELRISQDRSQENVAHDAGLTVAAFARIERGQSDPSWSSLVRIANALGITIAALGDAYDKRPSA
jgi:transcriptional regulator with XRE-family HTH domain